MSKSANNCQCKIPLDEKHQEGFCIKTVIHNTTIEITVKTQNMFDVVITTLMKEPMQKNMKLVREACKRY